ncbi:unnamed protein product [Rhizophagus irregularis]|nr:unnamed protein product [Rhizophagus irregularis]
MFKCAKAITPSKEESSTERKLPEISLDDESSENFKKFLSYIYPGNYQPITWQNYYQNIDSRAALLEKHMEYTNSLGRIDAETFVPRFNHINNHVTRHLKDFKQKLSQVIRHLQVLPNPPPSITYKLLSSLIKENNCGIY